MQKLLILYTLLFITTCTENESHNRGRKTTRPTSITRAETQKSRLATPDLIISIIVNHKIALRKHPSPKLEEKSTKIETKKLNNSRLIRIRTSHIN